MDDLNARENDLVERERKAEELERGNVHSDDLFFVPQNLWQSHDSSRRRNPENRWKSWTMIKIEIVFLGLHLTSSVVPYWKMDDFGRVEVAGLAGGWLAGRVS